MSREVKSGNLLYILLLFPFLIKGQTCYEHFANERFSEINVRENLVYGENSNYLGFSQSLYLDFYSPTNDGSLKRPLVLLVHGGFFVFGDKQDDYVIRIAEDLARRGYAVAAVGYRVGANLISPTLDVEIASAAIRGIHDLKAAIRYFKKSVEEDNPYGLDPDQFFVLGYSAGGVAGLTSQFYSDGDELSGIAAQVFPSFGGIEGNSGNPNYDSKIKGTVSLSGGILDTLWMDARDGPTLFVHGVADDVISANYDTVNLLGSDLLPLHGSIQMQARTRRQGNESELVLLGNADHYWPLEDVTYDAGMPFVFDWLARHVDCQELRSKDNELYFFPNPVTNQITIHFPEAMQRGGTVEIYDVAGRLRLREANVSDPYLEINDLLPWPRGTYNLVYYHPDDKTIYSSLFIKQE